jgi:hypothetical protein
VLSNDGAAVSPTAAPFLFQQMRQVFALQVPGFEITRLLDYTDASTLANTRNTAMKLSCAYPKGSVTLVGE